MVGGRRQLSHSVAHGNPGSLVNIDLIDAGSVNRGDRPGHRVLANTHREHFTAFGQQQLRIAESPYTVTAVKNHGSRDDRTEERSAADLVDSGDQAGTGGPGSLLVTQAAPQLLQQPQLGG